MSLYPTQTLFLDCLVQARHILGPENVRELWHKTAFKTSSFTIRMVTPSEDMNDGAWVITIPELETLPLIEQREAMLWIIAFQSRELGQHGPWTDLDNLCYQLGCLSDNSQSIRERWRKLAITRDVGLLPYSSLEDRPRCKVCAGPVATGAGWVPEESGFDPSLYGEYRSDVHHECKQFALRIMMPRLRATQAERARASAEVDK